MINFWISIDYDSFAVWRISGLKIFNYHNLKEFTGRFLHLGQKHETFIISSDRDIDKNDSNTGLYLEQLDLCYNTTKKYYSLNISALNHQFKTDIYFFQKSVIYAYDYLGAVRSFYVNNTGEVLKNINPGTGLTEKERNSIYLADMPPIFIPAVSFNEKDGVGFSVYLHTNIFFPRVLATFEISTVFADEYKYADNSELARLNAFKFNKWLNALTLLVNEYEGKIHIDTSGGIPKRYKHFVDVDGIII